MIYAKITLASIIALCTSSIGSSYLFQNAFIGAKSKKSSSTFQLCMSTQTATKHKALETLKGRYSGRDDFGIMNDEAVATSDLFVEADLEEVDPPKVGQTVTGAIIEMDDNGALLEIGGKMSGYIPVKEASLIPIRNCNTVMSVGQVITGEVIGTLKGMPVISLRSAQLVAAWEEVLNMRATDATFEVTITEVNRGGAIASFLGLKAFLPGSHYLGMPDASLIGQNLKVFSSQDHYNDSNYNYYYFAL